MGFYIYSNPQNPSEIIEIIQSVNDKHVFIKDNVKWNRVWTNPQIGADTKIDPFNSKAFVNKTGKNPGKLGDILDQSKEMSLRRESHLGYDPLKEKYYNKYSGVRKGKLHPDKKKILLRERLNKRGVDIDFDKS